VFAQTTSVAMVGAEARAVRIEAHVGRAKEAFTVVGLPDTSVREAKDRVRSAIISTGREFPHRRVTVNLSPANLPKAGSDYDLPMALGVLAAMGVASPASARVVAAGELSLDGSVSRTRSAIGAALLASRRNWPCLVADRDAFGAARVPGAVVYPVASLAEAVAVVGGAQHPREVIAHETSTSEAADDIGDVRGQPVARRALEIAAAGGHHLLMVGSPGAGKTMLAARLPGILPPLTAAEAVEVACVWASADRPRPISEQPPFRAPHHSASMAAVVGGGNGHPVPGELSLAHRGVLFLDELGEFPPHLLNSLRQPLEEGRVTIARRGSTITFPAMAQLVAASNPCPCGFRGDRLRACRCTDSALARYRRRLSGPFLDRFDLRIFISTPDSSSLLGPLAEGSEPVRERVIKARSIQADRGQINGRTARADLDRQPMEPGAWGLLAQAVDAGILTGRGVDRVRRVARTIADLADIEVVGDEQIAEALAFRGDL
jgi:magnesium chelatase family protein